MVALIIHNFYVTPSPTSTMLVYHLLTNPISFGGNSTPASRKKDALEILILISSGRLTSYTDYTRGVEVRIEWKPQAIRELIALAIPQELDMWGKGAFVTSALEEYYGCTNFDYRKKDEAITFCNIFMEIVFPNDPIAVRCYWNGDYAEIKVLPVDDNVANAILSATDALAHADEMVRQVTERVTRTMPLGRMPLSRWDEAFALIYATASILGAPNIEARSTGYMQDSDVNVSVALRDVEQIVWDALGELPPAEKRAIIDSNRKFQNS